MIILLVPREKVNLLQPLLFKNRLVLELALGDLMTSLARYFVCYIIPLEPNIPFFSNCCKPSWRIRQAERVLSLLCGFP